MNGLVGSMTAIRQVRMVACISLNGFIIGLDDVSAEDKQEFWKEVREADVIIGGRNTLNQMPSTGKAVALLTRHPENPLESAVDPEVRWNVDPYPSEVSDFVDRFNGKRILLCGGAMAYDLFVRWNLVDHLTLIIEPVILRRGAKLLAPPLTREGQAESNYVLLKCTPLNTVGTVRMDYGRPRP